MENRTIGKLMLNDMEFYAYHGVLPEEQKIGATYFVSLSLELDVTAALRTDNLDYTINYSEVYALTKDQMNIPSKLIEHAAGRIATKLIEHFEKIISVEIALTKTSPPVNGNLPKSTITFKMNRNEW